MAGEYARCIWQHLEQNEKLMLFLAIERCMVPFNCRRVHIENLCLTNANKSNLKKRNQI